MRLTTATSCKTAALENSTEKTGEKEIYIEEYKDRNISYVDEHTGEFEKTKIYLDVCGGGWVRVVYYNPNSCVDGQLVYDLLSNCIISAAGKACASKEDFWNYLYEHARQTLIDIDTPEFADAAKEFVELPCNYIGQSTKKVQ